MRPVLSDEELAKRFFARGLIAANSANDGSGDSIYLRETTIYAAACFSVASALRAAIADRSPEGGDAKQTPSRSDESGGAVGNRPTNSSAYSGSVKL